MKCFSFGPLKELFSFGVSKGKKIWNQFFCTRPPPFPERFFFLGYHKGKKLSLEDQRGKKLPFLLEIRKWCWSWVPIDGTPCIFGDFEIIFFLPFYHDLIDSSTPKLLFSKLMTAVNERQAIYYKLSKKCLAFRKVISVFHFGSISKKMCQITILSTFPLRRKGCRWVKKRDFGSEKNP